MLQPGIIWSSYAYKRINEFPSSRDFFILFISVVVVLSILIFLRQFDIFCHSVPLKGKLLYLVQHKYLRGPNTSHPQVLYIFPFHISAFKDAIGPQLLLSVWSKYPELSNLMVIYNIII